MTVRGGGDRSLTTVIRSALMATASTLDQLTGWLISSETDTKENQPLDSSINNNTTTSEQSKILLTWCFDFQPARSFNLSAEEQVFQKGRVGSENMRKR